MLSVYRVLREGKPEKLKNLEARIVSEDVNTYSRDNNGNAALHYAALFGRNSVVRAILGKAPYPERMVNWTNSMGETSLHLAAMGGDPTTVSILLENGAYPEALTEYGETIVHYAAVGRFDTLAYILTRLPTLNVSTKDSRGFSPLDFALQFCRLDNAILLLLAGSERTDNADLKWIEGALLKTFPSRGLTYDEIKVALPVILKRNPNLLISGGGPLWEGVVRSVKRLNREEVRSLVSDAVRGIRGTEENQLEAIFALMEDLPDEAVGDLRIAVGVLLGKELELPDRVSLPGWMVEMLLHRARKGDRKALALLSRAEMDGDTLKSVIYHLPSIAGKSDDDEALGRILSHLSPEEVVSVLRRVDDDDVMCKVVVLYGVDRVAPHLPVDLALSLIKVCDGEVREVIARAIPTEELARRVDYLLRDEQYDLLRRVLPDLSDKGIVKVIREAPALFYEALREGRIRPTFQLLWRIITLAHESGPLDPTWIGHLEAILEADPSLTVRTDRWGNSLLHYAALYPHIGVVKVLIRRGAGIFLNVPNRAGYTPLALSIRSGGYEVAEYLKNLGARP